MCQNHQHIKGSIGNENCGSIFKLLITDQPTELPTNCL